MDMSAACQSGVAGHCRHAQVVFDKFHVIKNAHEAVDKVRRAEGRLGGTGVGEARHQSQWIWRKNPENLSEQEQQRLSGIKDKNLCTAKAYPMRRVLQGIYRSADARTARPRFQVWWRWVRWVACFHKGNVFVSMGEAGGNGREASGQPRDALAMGSGPCLHGRIEQRVQRDQAQDARLPFHHALEHQALLRRRQAPSAPVLIPPKTARNRFRSISQDHASVSTMINSVARRRR